MTWIVGTQRAVGFWALLPTVGGLLACPAGAAEVGSAPALAETGRPEPNPSPATPGGLDGEDASGTPTELGPARGEESPPTVADPVAEPASADAVAEGTETTPGGPQPAEPPPVAPTPVPPDDPSELPPLDLPPAKPAPKAGAFAQGRARLGASIGWASSFGGGESVSWFILGLGAGYFALDGLELHGDVTTWIGDPFIATLTPGMRYVFYQVPTVKPYLGVMYRHYFITGSTPDTDSIGARAGLNFMISPASYFGGGVIVEHFLDDQVWSETPQVYPELVLSLMF